MYIVQYKSADFTHFRYRKSGM